LYSRIWEWITTPEAYLFQSHREADTAWLAQQLALLFAAGTVLALDGDLGAGKTTFSQSVAKAIGVTAIVNSPTFTLIKEYAGTQFPLYHMDVYRISLAEADELGLDDYFYGDGVTIVEWASRVGELLPTERMDIFIAHQGEHERSFHFTPHGHVYESWCNALKENGVIS
jgi:tRNA threonylcarbamoyladenosine biosynthesis protein TsaE